MNQEESIVENEEVKVIEFYPSFDDIIEEKVESEYDLVK